MVPVLIQPILFVVTTLYRMDAVGVTIIEAVIAPDGLHEYEVAAIVLSVYTVLGQEAAMETIVALEGGLTVIICVCVPEYPQAFVPVTVYSVVVIGETDIVLEITEPGCQV